LQFQSHCHLVQNQLQCHCRHETDICCNTDSRHGDAAYVYVYTSSSAMTCNPGSRSWPARREGPGAAEAAADSLHYTAQRARPATACSSYGSRSNSGQRQQRAEQLGAAGAGQPDERVRGSGGSSRLSTLHNALDLQLRAVVAGAPVAVLSLAVPLLYAYLHMDHHQEEDAYVQSPKSTVQREQHHQAEQRHMAARSGMQQAQCTCSCS
jgi:hypothetical protein